MHRVLVPVLLLPVAVSSSTYTQTDWSGGPGVPGPVEAWGSAFQQETHVCWSTPGQIGLDTNYIEQSFTTAVPILSGQGSPTAICSSDFNGDGLEDIAGGFWSTGRIHVVLNPGAGPWQPIVVDGAAPDPVMLSASDFDGDGDADLAVSESGADRISWFQNPGPGPVWTKRTVGVCPDAYACVAWDPDLDGDADILCTSRGDGWVGWFENANGAGTSWSLHVIDDAIQNPITAVTGDFDGNAGPDLAVAGTGEIRLAVYTSPGYGRTVVATDTLGCSFYGLVAADFDCDGMDDIAGGSVMAAGIHCFLGTGSPPSWSRVEVVALASSCIEARDLDSDGDLDIISSAAIDNGLVLRLNNGDGASWAPKPILPIGTGGFFWMTQGDFDGDGSSDLAGSSYSGQALVTLLWGDRAVLYTTGSLASSILHLGTSPGDPWFVRVEGNTHLTMRFRASDDPGQMGSWSAEMLVVPGYWLSLAGYLEPGFDYLQYLVSPAINEECGDPVLTSVSISDDITGIEGGGGPGWFVTPVSNPASGSISLRIVTSTEGSAAVDIFDVSGRLVETVHPGELGTGEHVITAGGSLPPGCYTVRYALEGCVGTLRVVLLR